jgi:hypothetical protein
VGAPVGEVSFRKKCPEIPSSVYNRVGDIKLTHTLSLTNVEKAHDSAVNLFTQSFLFAHLVYVAYVDQFIRFLSTCGNKGT